MKNLKLYALALLALAACTERPADPDSEPTGEPVSSETVIVENEIGATTTLNYNFSGNWQISNSADWFSISPLSGFEGASELTLNVKSLNENPRERVGYFDINVGGEDAPVRICVIQKSNGGAELVSTNALAPAEGGDVSVEILATEEFTAEFDQAWATVSNIEFGIGDVVLEDGTTVSALKQARITISTEANDESAIRTASLNISCAGNEYQIPVSQLTEIAKEVENWTSPFFRRTLAMRFTATWCGYCPMMAAAYEDAIENYPDRIVPFTVHAGSSDIDSEYGDQLGSIYRIGGYPSGVVNSVAAVQNMTLVQSTQAVVEGLTEEAVEELPSKTAIAAECCKVGNQLYLHCSVAAKEAGPYDLHVYLMEDGIVSNQSSYNSAYPGGSNYVHNYVERFCLTGVNGMEINPAEKSASSFNFEYTLNEEDFEDINNVYPVIFVTYDTDSAFNGSVTYAQYTNYGHIVDNAVKVPVNGTVDYEYEN